MTPLTLHSNAAVEALLGDDTEYVSPNRVLLGLTEEVALQKPSQSPHSIAEIVAHLVFWQTRLLDQLEGRVAIPVAHDHIGWPTAPAWEDLSATFLTTLERLEAHARTHDLTRELVRKKSVGYTLARHSGHLAYHVGQIVLLRRQLGAWPPPGGGNAW